MLGTVPLINAIPAVTASTIEMHTQPTQGIPLELLVLVARGTMLLGPTGRILHEATPSRLKDVWNTWVAQSSV